MLRFIILATISWILLSCKPKTQDADTKTIGKQANFMHRSSTLKVCYVTGERKELFENWFHDKKYSVQVPSSVEFRPEDRRAIDSIVKQEFTKELTGLIFSGFGDCTGNLPDLAIADVYVFSSFSKFADLPAEPDILGLMTLKTLPLEPSFDHYTDGFDDNVAHAAPTDYGIPARIYLGLDSYCHADSIKISREECVKMDSLHEFGHIAGLGHAHEHPDAVKDPACADEAGNVRPEAGKFGQKRVVGAYTAGSIMNYCHEDLYRVLDPKGKISSVKLLPAERNFIKSMTPPISK